MINQDKMPFIMLSLEYRIKDTRRISNSIESISLVRVSFQRVDSCYSFYPWNNVSEAYVTRL